MTTAHERQPWPGSLAWGEDWLGEAAGELEHLGFVLRDGSHAGSTPGPRLLVALRPRPTLEHFDPEEVTFWEAHDDRGRLATLTIDTPVPHRQPFSWGRIRITDRIPVHNQFLSFGGELLVDAHGGGEAIAAFTSRAPIVRWAGHSQGVDPFADEIGAFFARLMVPIDFQPDAEARIIDLDPEALYAAFLQHAARRMPPGSALRETDPALAASMDHEGHRIAEDAPAAWRDGEALLGWLELG